MEAEKKSQGFVNDVGIQSGEEPDMSMNFVKPFKKIEPCICRGKSHSRNRNDCPQKRPYAMNVPKRATLPNSVPIRIKT